MESESAFKRKEEPRQGESKKLDNLKNDQVSQADSSSDNSVSTREKGSEAPRAKKSRTQDKEEYYRSLITSALARYNESLAQRGNQEGAEEQETELDPPTDHTVTEPAEEKSNADHAQAQPIYQHIVPREQDVLFGRASSQKHHPGNEFLRQLCDWHRASYDLADRNGKTVISQNLVNHVRARGGRFLKFMKDFRCWREASSEEARLKVGHMLRDGRYKSQHMPSFLR